MISMRSILWGFFSPTTLCGVLVFDSVSRVPPPPHLPPPLLQLCQPPSFPYNFVTHQLPHQQLCHTPSHTPCFTPNFVNHHLSQTTLSHTIQLCQPPSLSTIFHTQLCQPPSFPYNFVTHHLSHPALSHTIFHLHTQLCQPPSFPYNFVTHHLSHPPLSHTIFHIHTQLCPTPSFTYHIYGRFAWQRGTDGTGWRAWSDLVARDAAALCVAGVAQIHIYYRFAWQAWHNLTSTFVLRGRRGTDGTGWRAWSDLVARDARHGTLRGRRGTNSHLPSFCVASVAQTHIYHRFAWQAWHKLTSEALCVAGVAQAHIYRRFAWQSWHKLTSTIVLRGRHGTDGSAGKCCLYDVRQGIG